MSVARLPGSLSRFMVVSHELPNLESDRASTPSVGRTTIFRARWPGYITVHAIVTAIQRVIDMHDEERHPVKAKTVCRSCRAKVAFNTLTTLGFCEKCWREHEFSRLELDGCHCVPVHGMIQHRNSLRHAG